MKLIDANPIIEKYKDYEYFSGYEDFDEGVETGVLFVIDELKKTSEIDPVHAAGGCYCKECQYYEPFRDYSDCSKTLPYGYCYYWKYEEGESPNEVDENDFCSKGIIKDGIFG